MAQNQKNEKKERKAERPIKRGHSPQQNASGVAATGGSRQGNIGHQSSDNSDNSHR